MYRIGIDVGSAYTKYCVMDSSDNIVELFPEKTPIRQRDYFGKKIRGLTEKYPDSRIISCGYGKGNIGALRQINELTALAKGAEFIAPGIEVILDIGGQDTKIIRQVNGAIKDFFINDKCAAGSGMFLANVCNMLGIRFEDICLQLRLDTDISLSSMCAVFAQSEIVELLANNVSEDRIISAVIKQVLIQAKPLLGKLETEQVLLSGGLTNIKGMASYAENILGKKCTAVDKGQFLSAIGAAVCGG